MAKMPMTVLTFDVKTVKWVPTLAGDWIRIAAGDQLIEIRTDENGFIIYTPDGGLAVQPVASNTVQIKGIF